MGKSCCIEGCDVSSPDVEYFKFPRSGTLLAAWVQATGAPGGDVCSAHFTDADYKSLRGKRRLLGTAVPSVFNSKPQPTENGDISTDSIKDANKSVKTNAKNKKARGKKSTEKAKADSTTDNDINNETIDKADKMDTIEKDESTTDTDVTDKTNVENGESSQDETRSGEENRKDDRNGENAQPEVNDIEELITTHQIKQPPLADRLNPDPLEDLIPAILDQANLQANLQVNLPPQDSVVPEAAKSMEMDVQEVGPNKLDVNQLANHYANKLDNQLTQIMSTAPVFIEVAVDQNDTRTESPQDCLMLLESVQCDIDPSSLMLPEHGPDTDSDMEILETDNKCCKMASSQDCLMLLESVQCDIDPSSLMLPEHGPDTDSDMEILETDNKVTEDPNPISLLTSSDEDEVIIEEPHIDTVEVSDETDEDDRPLQRFIKEKPKKSEKKKKKGNFHFFLQTTPFYCIQCDFKTTDESEFLQHNLEFSHLHTTTNTTIQVCPTCNYTTASKAQFSRHKRKHRDERNFKCHLCNYKARHSMSLIYHLRCHDPVEKKQEKFTCDKCGFSSNVKSEALNHLKNKSCGVNKYSCDQCSYKTKRRSDLRRHRLRRHSVDDSDEDFTI